MSGRAGHQAHAHPVRRGDRCSRPVAAAQMTAPASPARRARVSRFGSTQPPPAGTGPHRRYASTCHPTTV